MHNDYQWPEYLWPLADVKHWIADVELSSAVVVGPTKIYNEKLWGVTAEFHMGDEAVVFKGCKLPIFAQRGLTEALLQRHCPAYVPKLMAWQALPHDETWTLHRAFQGQAVYRIGDFAHILEMARTLAQIQVQIAELPDADKAPLPHVSLDQIPDMLDHMIDVVDERYLDVWFADDEALLREFDLPSNILEWLDYFYPKVAEWTKELIAGNWPIAIDHLDLNTSNAAVDEHGHLRIFDWEEAVMSSPFFSIDRLLHDADDFEDDPARRQPTAGPLLLTPNQAAIRNAYLDVLPWHSRAERERAFDLAICLAPIKTAYEGEVFNEAIRRENGSPSHAARCFGKAMHYWQALDQGRGEER